MTAPSQTYVCGPYRLTFEEDYLLRQYTLQYAGARNRVALVQQALAHIPGVRTDENIITAAFTRLKQELAVRKMQRH